jgi:methylmalonyl-CoA mutase N-terminal domain/subunit
MAAVMGGTQSLHTNSRDEALALPTQESAKIALRTQQIVANESGITKTADPMGGSHYLEELCDQIEADVWKYLKKIQKMGGSVKAIEQGFFQSEIRQNAYRLKKEADSGERIIVGVNQYEEDEVQPDLLRVDGRIEIQQNKAIKKLRSSRNGKKLENALSAMKSVADTEENLMPYIITAAKAFATTGEISNTFREVFGEYRPKEVF